MTNSITFENVQVGDTLPELVKPPIDRTQLALFAGASGDHNPIHLDDERAKAVGLPGVIVHGMLNMAILGQLLTGWVSQMQVKKFSNRFAAMAYPGDTVTCRGKVTDKKTENGENLVEVEIEAVNQNGATLLAGNATISLP